jgi:3-oxoacyl-[acyl-carrier-protein] synthase-3
MAKLSFDDISIKAVVTTAGDKKLKIEDEASKFSYDEKSLKRLKRSMGFESRYVLSDDSVCTSDLCLASAEKIFEGLDIGPESIDALIMVTQTPDYRAPSSAIIMQHRLGLTEDTIAYDINLGCSGFINGLFTAYSMINSGLGRVLLCVGDVASRFAYERDRNLTPLMGDAGSAVLIERGGGSRSYFLLRSDGSGYRHLIIPDGGCRRPFSKESLELRVSQDGSVRRDMDMYMNGAEIFNFTIKVVPTMFDELLEFAGMGKEDMDYFVLHQANRYILRNIAKRLGVSEDRLPMDTVSIYGNQNSASIPGTINAFLSDSYSNSSLRSIFAGFGIGLSWGACIVDTESIFAPGIFHYEKKERE